MNSVPLVRFQKAGNLLVSSDNWWVSSFWPGNLLVGFQLFDLETCQRVSWRVSSVTILTVHTVLPCLLDPFSYRWEQVDRDKFGRKAQKASGEEWNPYPFVRCCASSSSTVISSPPAHVWRVFPFLEISIFICSRIIGLAHSAKGHIWIEESIRASPAASFPLYTAMEPFDDGD